MPESIDESGLCPECRAELVSVTSHNGPTHIACPRFPFDHFPNSEEYTTPGGVVVPEKSRRSLLQPHPSWRNWEKKWLAKQNGNGHAPSKKRTKGELQAELRAILPHIPAGKLLRWFVACGTAKQLSDALLASMHYRED